MTRVEIRHWKEQYRDQLFGIAGVVGVGITRDPEGAYLLSIHLDHDSDESRARVDDLLGAIPHRFLVSGPFRLLGG